MCTISSAENLMNKASVSEVHPTHIDLQAVYYFIDTKQKRIAVK